MINKVILVGNLGRDPELRHLENESKVATFTMATNENYRDKSGEWQTVTQWHNVVAWRYLAEQADRRLSKGSLVYIEGKLTHRKYQDKEGNDRYISEVVANVIRPLDKQGSNSDSQAPAPSETSKGSSAAADTSAGSGPKKSVEEFEDDDLPF